MTMTHDDPSSDTTSADDAWLAALAGRGPDPIRERNRDRADPAHAQAAREATLMREAVRRWTPAIDPVAADDPERIAKLVARARDEGLLEDRNASGEQQHRSHRTRGLSGRLRAWWTGIAPPHFATRPAWAMAVAVIAVVALVYVMRPATESGLDDDATVRSATDAVTLLRARDPQALRREIVAALERQGVAATVYARFGRVGIDADLPRPLSPAVKTVLDRYRIPAPGDGVLRVEIEAERR